MIVHLVLTTSSMRAGTPHRKEVAADVPCGQVALLLADPL